MSKVNTLSVSYRTAARLAQQAENEIALITMLRSDVSKGKWADNKLMLIEETLMELRDRAIALKRGL
jgi:hypothetical protein